MRASTAAHLTQLQLPHTRMRTLLILSVVVLGFASFLKRKLCALSRHDDHALQHWKDENEDTFK